MNQHLPLNTPELNTYEMAVLLGRQSIRTIERLCREKKIIADKQEGSQEWRIPIREAARYKNCTEEHVQEFLKKIRTT